jgi:hypothetical protein
MAAILVLTVLGGCSGFSGFSGFGGRSEPPPADPNVFPKDYRTQVADFLRTYLENPTGVREAFISEPALKPVGQRQQYVSCVRYNPRDSKQQYMGHREDIAIFLGGRLTQYLPGNREMCGAAAYQRYPEIEKMVP